MCSDVKCEADRSDFHFPPKLRGVLRVLLLPIQPIDSGLVDVDASEAGKVRCFRHRLLQLLPSRKSAKPLSEKKWHGTCAHLVCFDVLVC